MAVASAIRGDLGGMEIKQCRPIVDGIFDATTVDFTVVRAKLIREYEKCVTAGGKTVIGCI